MQIRIVKPGVLTTVQDLGRRRYLSQAVPVSGAMDVVSARIANMAVGNDGNAAVIEFAYSGAEFEVIADALIAYSGDGAVLMANDKAISSNRPVFVPKGTIVSLTDNTDGNYTYIAVAGGWDMPEVLGSRSTYITAGIGGLDGRALQAGDALTALTNTSAISQKIFNDLKGDQVNPAKWSLSKMDLVPADKNTIRVVPGQEFTWFEAMSLIDFLTEPFALNLNSNRMGYRFDGPVMKRVVKDELLSTAVTPGTIQVTGDGSLILLMADCQTTGGYPRIAQVAAVDMPLCAQLKPGAAVNFKEISRQEAEMLYIEQEHELNRLANAIKNKFL